MLVATTFRSATMASPIMNCTRMPQLKPRSYPLRPPTRSPGSMHGLSSRPWDGTRHAATVWVRRRLRQRHRRQPPGEVKLSGPWAARTHQTIPSFSPFSSYPSRPWPRLNQLGKSLNSYFRGHKYPELSISGHLIPICVCILVCIKCTSKCTSSYTYLAKKKFVRFVHCGPSITIFTGIQTHIGIICMF
jgi:hypothetical protein